jgi:hypothetical protein
MAAEQISIFDFQVSPADETGLKNNYLFPSGTIEDEMRRGRWRSVKAPGGIRAALEESVKSGNPAPALKGLGWHITERPKSRMLLSSTAGESGPAALALAGDPQDAAASCQLLCRMAEEKTQWGIISNGASWRLYRAGLPAAPDRWFGAETELLLSGPETNLKTFSLLFGCAPYSKNESFADAAHRSGAKHVSELQGNLARAAESAATAICRGFVSAEKQTTGATPTPDALQSIYKHTLIIIHRLIFIFHAERRGILPGDGENYRADFGLGGLAGRIPELRLTKKNLDLKFTLWKQLQHLFDRVHRGDVELGIPCLGGVLMDPETHPFLSGNEVSDSFMADAIEALAIPGGALGRPGDAFEELDAADIVLALSYLPEFRARLAREPILLIEEKGKRAWRPKKTVKWRKAEAAADTGEVYLERAAEANGKTFSYETLSALAAKTFVAEDSGSGPFFVPETGAGLMLLAGIDAAARRHMASGEKKSASFSEALLQTARLAYGLDPNPLNADLARLGIWLLTIGDQPPLHLEHNIRPGNIPRGVAPGDFANLPDITEAARDELTQIAREVRQAWAGKRPGLSGIRTRADCFKKIERKINKLMENPDKPDAAGRAGAGIAHPLFQFPEVFFSEERPSGFEALIVAPPANPLGESHIASPRKKSNPRRADNKK